MTDTRRATWPTLEVRQAAGRLASQAIEQGQFHAHAGTPEGVTTAGLPRDGWYVWVATSRSAGGCRVYISSPGGMKEVPKPWLSKAARRVLHTLSNK